MVLEQ